MSLIDLSIYGYNDEEYLRKPLPDVVRNLIICERHKFIFFIEDDKIDRSVDIINHIA